MDRRNPVSHEISGGRNTGSHQTLPISSKGGGRETRSTQTNNIVQQTTVGINEFTNNIVCKLVVKGTDSTQSRYKVDLLVYQIVTGDQDTGSTQILYCLGEAGIHGRFNCILIKVCPRYKGPKAVPLKFGEGGGGEGKGRRGWGRGAHKILSWPKHN